MNPHRYAQHHKRRFRVDWIAKQVITAFGWLVLATFALLVWHVFSNAFPLFKQAKIDAGTIVVGEANVHIWQPLQTNPDYAIGHQACDLLLLKQRATEWQLANRRPFACIGSLKHTASNQRHLVAYITPQGLLEVNTLEILANKPVLTLAASIAIDTIFRSSQDWQIQVSGQQIVVSFPRKGGSTLYWFDRSKPQNYQRIDLSGEKIMPLIQLGQILVIRDGVMTFVNRQQELIERHILPEPVHQVFTSRTERALFINYKNKQLDKWLARNDNGRFVYASELEQPLDLVENIQAMVFDDATNAAFIRYDNAKYSFMNATTAQLFSWRETTFPASRLLWQGKYIYGVDDNRTVHYQVSDIQGITTFKSVFGEVFYEGYQKADYVWQTSSASPGYELKHSIIPLLIGSLKASILALFVAIPLGLGAAVYTAFFASPQLRKYIKPSIEMLEAIPSVVLGFIAAVWLAPLAESFLIAIVIFLVLLPPILLAVALSMSRFKKSSWFGQSARYELIAICIGLIVLMGMSILGGDIIQNLLSNYQSAEQQQLLRLSKTGIVVAIALGVAITPSIYSLAEDALYQVPVGIKHAAFALGATHLQTLKSVVFVVALPSILSAVMLGFGRAFGETMIVLMVTGNTPISTWDIFEGMRSLTANLAIELQESQVDSLHFNLLFLTASLLFVFTFIVNTAAELIRRKLRKGGVYG